MKQSWYLLVAACALAAAAGPGRADFAVIPLHQLIARSDLVVVGKITAIERDTPSKTATDKATITVEEVLLGEAGETVVLGFPGKRVWITDDGREMHVEASSWIRYKMDQEGIWILTRDDEAKLYTATHPACLQPREKLDEVKAAIKQAEEEKASPPPPTDEERAMIELWITEEGLNKYGDPKDTAYAGGTPLDEGTAQEKDRHAYILEHHPRLIEQLRRRYAPKGAVAPPVEAELQERIDAWLREHKLNRYGDPEGTEYPNWSPLLDVENKVLRERYRYVLDKLPELRRDLGLDEN